MKKLNAAPEADARATNPNVPTPTLPARQPGAGHKPELRRQSLDYDTNAASLESAITCPEPTLAQQQYAEESDINYIADRYGLTGEMPQVLNLPSYGDFTGIYDFQTAQNAVIAARNQFMTLPAKMRARFDNDPQKLLAFLDDEDNRELAIAMGLVNPPQKMPDDAPQSPQGNAGDTAKGGTLPPDGTPPAEPDKKGAKKAPKDT